MMDEAFVLCALARFQVTCQCDQIISSFKNGDYLQILLRSSRKLVAILLKSGNEKEGYSFYSHPITLRFFAQ